MSGETNMEENQGPKASAPAEPPTGQPLPTSSHENEVILVVLVVLAPKLALHKAAEPPDQPTES